MNHKILLFGGSGFLGSHLKDELKTYKLFSPNRNTVNLLDINKLLKYLERLRPDLIIYSAGITKIDLAEKNKTLTNKLNFEIPKKISQFAFTNDSKVIYISTDAVFDGYRRKFEFTEKDRTFAKSAYGKSKLLGEDTVLSRNSKNLVLRAITYFGGNNENNFANAMIKNLKANKPYLGIYDQIQNPLSILIGTKAVKFSIENDLKGIYNLGSLDSDSNYNFLVKLARKNKLNSDLIKKISFKEFMRDKSGHRKQKSVLLVDKFNEVSNKKILKTINQSINSL